MKGNVFYGSVGRFSGAFLEDEKRSCVKIKLCTAPFILEPDFNSPVQLVGNFLLGGAEAADIFRSQHCSGFQKFVLTGIAGSDYPGRGTS